MHLLKHIKSFIVGRNLTNAENVESLFLNYQPLKDIRKFMKTRDILGRSFTNVMTVTDPISTIHHLEGIRKFILHRNYTNAWNVNAYYPWKPEVDCRFSEAGVLGNCKLLFVCWKLNPYSLEEEPVSDLDH